MNVVILGASLKQERYSYKAMKALEIEGHKVFPVNPSINEIENIKVFHSISEIKEPIHTITIYLSPERSSKLTDEILALKPKRVIFNPGAENEELSKKL
ncbi:MAG TPA: CoA-binding protein, partial [Victivallales bacterium]|nr:CoA-binding protein [Victivallales bacterium]